MRFLHDPLQALSTDFTIVQMSQYLRIIFANNNCIQQKQNSALRSPMPLTLAYFADLERFGPCLLRHLPRYPIDGCAQTKGIRGGGEEVHGM